MPPFRYRRQPIRVHKACHFRDVSNVRSATVQEGLSRQYVGSYTGIIWFVSPFLPLYSKQTSALVHFLDLWLGNHYCANLSIVYCIVFTVHSGWNKAFRIEFHDCILLVRSVKYERITVREKSLCLHVLLHAKPLDAFRYSLVFGGIQCML